MPQVATGREEGARRFREEDFLPRRLNLGCGYDLREGYVNADAYVDDPVVLPLDLTQTPWDLPSGHFEEVVMRHVLEHVPPLFSRDAQGRPRDVLVDVFEELHRVLAPDGVVKVSVPYGGTRLGHSHWQHYRHVTPDWFKLLNRTHPEARPYRFNFDVCEGPTTRVWAAHWGDRLQVRGTGLTTHLAERFRFLRPVLAKHVELNFTLRKLPL